MLAETPTWKIERICSDRGGEYTSNAFIAFYKSQGIQRHLTA
jgi:hypothetical protein